LAARRPIDGREFLIFPTPPTPLPLHGVGPIEPMTLGNMRANGVRSLDVACWNCHHRAIMSAESWPDHVPVPTFGPRMVCTRCGIVGADARPNWLEKSSWR
jgi:hypothetical protein